MIIYRAGSYIFETEVDEQTIFSQTLMGEEKIVSSFLSPVDYSFQIGDYILLNGKKFEIVGEINKQQLQNSLFKYDIEFYSEVYKLYNALIKHLGRTKFSYFGTPSELLSLIVSNMGEGWYVGGAPALEPQLFEFKDMSCRVALSDIASKFQLEYYVDNQNVYLVEAVGSTKGVSLGYGKNQGAYDITRQSVSNSYATVWYAFGGSQNLPAGYRDGQDRLTLNSPIEVNVGTYGRKEGVIEYDFIYPHRTGTISGVVSATVVVDSSLDFNLNEQNITDAQAKIIFQSGELNGQEFFITKYDTATKQITFQPNKDETGYETPNSTFSVAVGDRYTLVGITMPNSYITAAETELYNTALAYATQNSRPQFSINVNVDEKYIRENGYAYALEAGDKITITAPKLNYSGLIRIQSISYPLVNPNKLTLTLSNTVNYSVSEQLVKDSKEQKKNIVTLRKGYNGLKVKLGWKTTQELLNMTFDPDGYFDAQKIKPLSIETGMLVVGAKSQQFLLEVIMQPNYEGNVNVFQVSNGVLVHGTIEEMIRTWQITGQTITVEDNNARYIYAKCNKTDYNDAHIILSTEQIKPNDNALYYHFWVGVLHSVMEGVRWISLSYGTTSINGRFIKTGRIQDASGETYFDLDEGVIKGKITFINSDNEYEDIADLADKSATHFTTTPVPPYKVGDIWTDGSFFYRCITKRLSGDSFHTEDWQDATEYDSTQTVIDGGLVTSGTIQVAGDATIKAGMTGNGTDETSVRFWAGDTYGNRGTAPFRVLQNGVVYALNAVIQGVINATEGSFGVLSILGNSIINNFNSLAQIVLRNDSEAQFSAFGTNVKPATSPDRAGLIIEQKKADGGWNIGAELRAANSTDRNVALWVPEGEALMNQANVNGKPKIEATLNNQNLQVDCYKYSLICINPTGVGDSGVTLLTDNILAGKQVTIINLNMGKAMFVYNSIRGLSSVIIEAGGGMICEYTGTYWYVVGSN